MSTLTPVIQIESPRLYYTGVMLVNPAPTDIVQGINVVIGANGAGKSTLGNILEKGWNFRTNVITSPREKPTVKKIEFSDIHSLPGLNVEYYQQRYEATMNDEVPSVAEIMGEKIGSPRWKELTQLFHLNGIEERKINFLSSGELRKLLIINALIEPADVIILDNPYIGLDATSRTILDEAIDALAGRGITTVLLVANPRDIHPHATQVIPMQNLTILPPVTDISSVKWVKSSVMHLFDYAINVGDIPLPPAIDNDPVNVVMKITGGHVSFGGRPVIEGLDWEVKEGQCWGLSGPNGSGKSTLLSLICADNPQAYSNDIILFDRRRGSGESIWDIKRRISFVSPEQSLHFHPAGDVATIVAQGLNDTTGVFIPLKPGQKELAMQWLQLLHMEHLAPRSISTLSGGERQMVMLARTFIKQPRLMIFDEPLHGLDYARARAARAIINHFAARSRDSGGRYPLSIIFVSHYTEELPECVIFTKTLAKTSCN
ncbi:MAG: ATP-binding cassette domain-containing protein [Muribaculaceae bacterium]|nr:ATP-binding cassette domain-containing protein [Muribaculaceae bacterium]